MATPLGKSLVFYLKYPAEMARLYEEKDREQEATEGLENPERTLEMVQAVGDAAGEQAADFLLACSQGIEKHFGDFAKYQGISRRSSVINNWSWQCGIWMKGRKPNRLKLYAGVSFETNGGHVVPWVWCRGKAAADEHLRRVLGPDTQFPPPGWLGWSKGTAMLAKIPVLGENQAGFDVDRDPLLKKVEEAFKTIGPHHVHALTSLNL